MWLGEMKPLYLSALLKMRICLTRGASFNSEGLDDVKNGRVNRMEKWESLDDFLDRMGHV